MPHSLQYKSGKKLQYLYNIQIGDARVETQGFQYLVRFLHKNRSFLLFWLVNFDVSSTQYLRDNPQDMDRAVMNKIPSQDMIDRKRLVWNYGSYRKFK